MEAWDSFFITLQTCWNCILESNGGNDYKIPHLSKRRWEKLKRLPVSLHVSYRAREILDAIDAGNTSECESDISHHAEPTRNHGFVDSSEEPVDETEKEN